MKLKISAKLLATFFFISWGSLVYAQGTDDLQGQKDELERIRAELEAKRKSIEKLKQKEKGLLKEVQSKEEELELIENLLLKINRTQRGIGKQLKEKEGELFVTQQTLEEKQAALARRLREIYKYRRFYEYKLLWGADSPVDFLKRYRFMQLITQKDRDLIGEVQTNKQKVEEKKSYLQKRKNYLALLRKEKTKEEENKKQLLSKRSLALKNVRQEKELQLQALQELEISAQEIQKIILRLEEKRKAKPKEPEIPEGVFASLKGKLPWPTAGAVIGNFGQQLDKKSNTVTFNPGLEIQAQIGQDVFAVADGLLIYSGWLRGYGRFIILQHDSGYYTLYAHLSEVFVEEGEDIKASQVLAKVGETGFLGEISLHFEVRQGKQQLDPLEWLK